MSDQPAAATDLLTSPLHERHVALGAKFAEFGGWSMPLEYPSGVVKEHTAVREAVGIFDVSHLGKALVSGPGAAAYVNATLTNDLGRIAPGRAQYTLCCDDATGGVVDDLIAYLFSDDDVFLVPNAANTAEVVRRLAASAPEGIAVTDDHRTFAILAVQGPQSAAPGPTTPALPRCDTSNTPTAVRTAVCSLMTPPPAYSSGISQPPNDANLAPSAS